LNFWVW